MESTIIAGNAPSNHESIHDNALHPKRGARDL